MTEVTGIATPEEIRKARAFLHQRGIHSGIIPARLFAYTAKKSKKSFADLLNLIVRLKMGGQGLGQSPIASSVAETGGM